jgi:hypothetical protein
MLPPIIIEPVTSETTSINRSVNEISSLIINVRLLWCKSFASMNIQNTSTFLWSLWTSLLVHSEFLK